MKVYSDVLTEADLWAALPAGLELMDGYYLTGTRARRFEKVRLVSPVARKVSRRHPNSGTHGAESRHYCASWDEHGVWMARLFEKDSDARIIGYEDYRGAETFHRITDNRYRNVSVSEDADGVWVRTDASELCGPYQSRDAARGDFARV